MVRSKRVFLGLILSFLPCVGGCPGGNSGPTEYDIGGNDPNGVVAFGDSISDGYDSYNGMGYRDDLEYLFASDGRSGIRVLDEGEPGTFSEQGVERINTVLARDRPAVLILLYGTNDEVSEVPMGTTIDNLRQIVNASRANQTIVVLSTIPPVCGPEREFQRVNIIALNEEIRSLGKELRAADDNVFFADAWDAFISAAPPDGCSLINPVPGNHPNEEGYGVLARTYYKALGDARW
jgi:lysophospholipase L1-like esterase